MGPLFTASTVIGKHFNFGSVTTLVFIAVGVGLWLTSHLVEALRRAPQPPEHLRWAPDIPVAHVTVDGSRLRYIQAGQGAILVLLHTLRTQLDLFEKIVPELARDFRIYAFDYPGHGYSDIPRARYDADFFVRSLEGFLDALDLRGVTLCGVSIGASAALIAAGRGNARVSRVIAINPYDYAKGRGMARSSLSGTFIVATARVPVLGETIMRLRNFAIMSSILQGGVANKMSITHELRREMYNVGNRRGHYRAFLDLLRHAASWEKATTGYRNIRVPVRLIWGDRDWAYVRERERDRSLIPAADMLTINDGGHFLPLDQPGKLRELISEFMQD